jgi:hypothetical protein
MKSDFEGDSWWISWSFSFRVSCILAVSLHTPIHRAFIVTFQDISENTSKPKLSTVKSSLFELSRQFSAVCFFPHNNLLEK